MSRSAAHHDNSKGGPRTPENEPQVLSRALTSRGAAALVVGTVIGTGVFLKSASMLQAVGSPTLVLLAWVAAGLLSLAGALSYAELGAMFPQAGGDYVYLRNAYGDITAFLFGWMQFGVAISGGIAAVATAFAVFLAAFVPMGAPWMERTFVILGQQINWQFGLVQVTAVAAIVLFSSINCIGVKEGSSVQILLAGAKVLGVVGIVGGVFFFSTGASWSHLSSQNPAPTGLTAFAGAMIAALWAYDGWYVLPVMAGEVENPQRNLPLGLIAGMMLVLMLYLLINLGYFYALPQSEIINANSTAYPEALSVAAKTAQTFLGSQGAVFISAIFAVSSLGALNGCIMLSRIPFAMARDGLFFAGLGRVSGKSNVPRNSIIVQCIWSSILALSGNFDQITTFTIFGLWLFYGITVSTVFVFRRRLPNAHRPYRTLGYPWIPLLFVVTAVWLVVSTVAYSPVESAIGLGLTVLGLPLYFFFRKRIPAAPLTEVN